MKRKACKNGIKTVPNARYRKRHSRESELPPPRVMKRRRNIVFVDSKGLE